MPRLPRSRALLTAVVGYVAIAALAPSALAQWDQGMQLTRSSLGSPSQASTRTTVVCKRVHRRHIRCAMAVKDGAGVNGTVTMRVKRGRLLVALGHGRVRRGKAALTMRLRRRMTPGRYTVSMVMRIKAKKVLRLR